MSYPVEMKFNRIEDELQVVFVDHLAEVWVSRDWWEQENEPKKLLVTVEAVKV